MPVFKCSSGERIYSFANYLQPQVVAGGSICSHIALVYHTKLVKLVILATSLVFKLFLPLRELILGDSLGRTLRGSAVGRRPRPFFHLNQMNATSLPGLPLKYLEVFLVLLVLNMYFAASVYSVFPFEPVELRRACCTDRAALVGNCE